MCIRFLELWDGYPVSMQNTTQISRTRGQMAWWIRRLTGNPRVPSSIPCSNSLCSCHILLTGGAVAMVTEMALSDCGGTVGDVSYKQIPSMNTHSVNGKE